ncbi:trypsin-like serine protease [Skermanella pratensis]|uniref:trypsin-like serine protease n=1 Tax=Skermanella pratensis TaxID=2233999 RepID=UPI001300E530|nr:trypsin-like serine protease [Skermanella pratensis]
MFKLVFSIFIVSTTLNGGTILPALAQDSTPPVIMEPPTLGTAADTQILGPGSEKLQREDWEATLKHYFSKQDGETYTCTSTIVGDKVLLTAAHRIGQGSEAQVKLDLKTSTVVCEHFSGYDGKIAGDVAICRTKDNKPFSANFRFENVDLSGTRVKKDTKLFLAGFGCRAVDKRFGGTLYGGLSRLFEISKEDGKHHLTREGVTICPGDSGGGAYALQDMSQPKGKRYFVAINSAWDPATLISYLAPINTPGIVKFINEYATRHGLKICGVHPDAQRCKN